MSFDKRIEKLNQVCRGWLNYFKYASINLKLMKIDGLLRIMYGNHEYLFIWIYRRYCASHTDVIVPV